MSREERRVHTWRFLLIVFGEEECAPHLQLPSVLCCQTVFKAWVKEAGRANQGTYIVSEAETPERGSY
jgi:hypothetical protein